MKRTILLVLTIAILGALNTYVQKKPSAQTSNSMSTANAGTSSSQANNPAISGNSKSKYKDGTYQGSPANTPYGTVQVALVISGGKIMDVNFIQMPNDQGHSREVTAFAEPLLKQSTLHAQSASIEFVSGATSTSEGYVQSLQAAIDQAVKA